MKITLCIDKQQRSNPSEELKQYLIDIGCPLRSLDEVFDELKINTNDNNSLEGKIIRRCYVDKYGVLKKLDTEEVQTLDIPTIELFEGTNYVYILEYTNLNMKIEYLTNAEMNKYFATKMEMNSTIQQTYDSIMLKVSEKADSTEVSSMIKMLADEIALRVIKGDVVNELNISDELISIIGNRLKIDTTNFKLSEEGSIEAKSGKIAGYLINNNTLKGSNVGMCGVAGEEYAFWAGNEKGVDAPFRVGHGGDLRCSNAEITGGNIKLDSPYNNPQFIIGTNSNNNYNTYIAEGQISLGNSSNTNGSILIDNINSSEDNDTVPTIWLSEKNSNVNNTTISSRAIDTPVLYQHSLSEMKKNFEKLDNALEIINDTDIYKYNLKDEKDNKKKHIGAVIGIKYNCSEEIINNEKNGIDQYSMTSVAWQAIKDQQLIIKELKNEIEVLKNELRKN